MLRRQLRRNYRKPLINFNSKKLLKFKPVHSSLYILGKPTCWVNHLRHRVQTCYPWQRCQGPQKDKTSAGLQWAILLWFESEKGWAENISKYFLLIVRIQRLLEWNSWRHSHINTSKKQLRPMTRMCQSNGHSRNTRIMAHGTSCIHDWRSYSTDTFYSTAESPQRPLQAVPLSFIKSKKHNSCNTSSRL